MKNKLGDLEPMENKRIFITGGTGTMGKALLRHLYGRCTGITVFSRDAARQMNIKREFPDVRMVQGDIRDYDRLYLAMTCHDVVIHVAAQKHIGWGEQYPEETLTINVDGSRNVAQAAIAAEVKRVVGISTDKACYASNVYGASKLAMERVFTAVNGYGPIFTLCRYGNVVGSRGSVIPLWFDAVTNGRPLQVTDPEMTRFWITEAQAVGLVLTALTMPAGSVTIPKAPSMKIGAMAAALFPMVDMEVIGSRPGEKADECLMMVEESYKAWDAGEVWVLADDQPTAEATKPMMAGYFSNVPHRMIDAAEMRLMAQEVGNG
jgi:UDP-N-acetylglucosamine 4,6-dehydratase